MHCAQVDSFKRCCTNEVGEAQQGLDNIAQAQADARSAETEEAYEQAALLDGALTAAEATQADLAQQVCSHVQPCVLAAARCVFRPGPCSTLLEGAHLPGCPAERCSV
jgi:hypothetical protein